MTREGQSRVQRLVTRFVDAETAAAIEAHSRAWLVRCQNCGLERSIWDLGGIRYRAAGRPRLFARCPRCGATGWHRVEKAAGFPTSKAPIRPLLAVILSFVVAVLILVAVVLAIVLWLAGAA